MLSHGAQAQDNAAPAVATGAVGSIFGQITEADTGRELTNVTVRVSGSGFQVRSGSDGRFSILGLAPGSYDVEFSLAGYSRQSLRGILVKSGEATRTDVSLALELFELPLLEVMADPLDDYGAELRLERFESSSLVENIGSDLFSRLNAGDAAKIITKATGITVVEGKTAVVRGLSDRYNLTLLNGGEVPSADPYRKSAQLDMFTSDVLESVSISKTFTPDLPGGFSGALIDLRTKSFPEEFFFKFSAGVGYNSQSTGNEKFLTYPGGSLDFLGMDDGTRALPQELEGVTGNDLTKLSAIYSNASLANNTPEAIERKRVAAEQMAAYTTAFGTDIMGPTTDAPPPDHSFNLLVGNTLKIGDRPLGYFVGLGYDRDFRFYEDGVRARYGPASTTDPRIQRTNSYFADTRSQSIAQWSGLVNLAYQPSEQHEIAFNFLYSQVSEDEARHLSGSIETSGEDQFGNTNRVTHLNTLYFAERNLTYYQLKGRHEFPELMDLRIDWLGALANASQDEPDLRYFNLIADSSQPGDLPLIEVSQNYLPDPTAPTRYFRNLEDNSANGKLDFTLPFEDHRALEWKLKSGLFLNQSERTYLERTFSYSGGNGTIYDPLAFPYAYLALATPPVAVTNQGRVFYEVSRSLNSQFGNSSYTGSQTVEALYGLLEIPLLPSLRLMGGVRYETTDLETTSVLQGGTPSSSAIRQNDLLPAVNLTWSLQPGMNVRASYAETIARPTYREFADTRSYDQFSGIEVRGNPLLSMSAIKNYDLRWEWFTPQGGLLGVGAFYKQVEAPIERVNGEVGGDGTLNLGGNVLTFVNGPEATVWGLEFETRQNLGIIDEFFEPFSAGVNFAWINAEVDNLPVLRDRKLANGITEDAVSRPLYDQSPYIFNADFSYDHRRSGTSVTVIYFWSAERLSLITEAYDVYQQPTPTLDLVISQRLGKHFKLKFAIENLLNPDVIESYAVGGRTDTRYVFSSYSKGINYGLSISGEF